MKKMVEETYLTTKEVAEKFKTTPKNVDQWCNEGRLPFTKIGNARLFPVSGIEKILRANLREAI